MFTLALAANVIGMTGTALVVGTYIALQLGRIKSESLAFNVLNLVGAILLLLSLLVHFNLASFVIEVFWIAASLVGLWRYWSHNRRAQIKTPAQHPTPARPHE